MAVECIQSGIPLRLNFCDPAGDLLQRFGTKQILSLPSLNPARQQASFNERAQMLRDRLPRDGKTSRKPRRRRGFFFDESLNNQTARRISQCQKDGLYVFAAHPFRGAPAPRSVGMFLAGSVPHPTHAGSA